MTHIASDRRYESMHYNRCGKSGLKLPAISLGLWHNFGGVDTLENGRAMLRRAFDLGIGCIVFSPLAQGLLTDRYLKGIPADSRVGKGHGYLHREDVTEDKVAKARHLNEVAQARGQSLAQMAIAWMLRKPEVTSALIGASRVQQIDDCVAALEKLEFSKVELDKIEGILAG